MKIFIQKTLSQKLINSFLFCENYLMAYNFSFHKYIQNINSKSIRVVPDL